MSEVTKVDHGQFLLNDGDDARTVAYKVYGDGNKYQVLLSANPEDWEVLEHVKIPNKKGRVTTVEPNDSFGDLIRRMFPGQPQSIYVAPFFKWNGGVDHYLLEGDEVFIPER
jgi:hypothetical protein